ncbi:putative ATP-dependent RNA helicase TDRD12 [Strongylocentrotus purpuratus]|uniref:RNA helicase n=1 Tax=Strongylocentrotus purpuratus TaxID=7668 RepID=A0A7M7N521_STRPU|nr:putative ATP-dependent RNA helicase TDRD12 [Strongylocentrotus purpuratus]
MMTNITILKIDDPFHFWGKEVLGPGVSHETIQFQELCDEIEDYCSSDQYVIDHVNNPVKGKMYLAQRPSDSKWYRARVLSNYQTAHAIKALCHLVDYAESFLVPINRLKEIPAKLKMFPSQAKPFRLHGLQPTTLHVAIEENQAELGPAEKWDIAAVEFFMNIVEDRSAEVDIHGIGQKDTRFVTLHVNTPHGQVNVNEELLKLGYAVSVEREFDEVSEIGSSEGGCSRPMTPRTYTPKISSPPRITEVEQSETEIHGAGPSPWTPGGQSPSGQTLNGETQRTSGGILVRHAPDEDVRLRSPRARGSSPSLGQVQDQVQDEMSPDSTSKDVEGSQLTPSTGRGRGLAGLVRTSEVGRTRSPSPLSPLSSTTSPPSNILKSANLQRMLEKSPRSSPSAPPSKSPQSSPSAQPSRSPHPSPSSQSSKSPKSSTQPSLSPRPLDENVVPRPGIHKPLVISKTTRQPFMRDVSVRPKELPSKQVRTPRQSETKSPPTLVSPVRDSKLPWKHKTHRGASQQSPSLSDWNKMSSTSGQSDVSEGEVTTPVRAKTTPTSSPSERAKIIQESLLKQLKSGSPEDEPRTGSSSHHHGNEMGVIMHGDLPPDPIRQIKNAPFPEVIKKVYQREKTHMNISLLEAYAWPAVLRGRDLVGVAPRDGANTLAFLLPVITQLLQSSTYTNLPPGNGPLALILCTSWEHAESVCQLCEKFVRAASKSINTIFLYGGNNEKQQEVQLVNGCQILISTLPCVLKMKERNLTNFNRLCHVIFDEGNILFRDFFDEVKIMMQELLSVLRVDQRRSAPRQLLVFANEWTSAIGSFLRTYMTNQLVVITHKLEAAVYARVRQNIEMMDSSQRTQVMLSKLQSGMLKGTKSIIFANDRKTAAELMKILTSASIYTLLATDDMPSDSIERIKKEWYTHHRPDSIPILVMTDGAINDVEITDAMYIIHYDFPSNKAHYGKRMGCMIRHFESQLKEVSYYF